ncbi:glycoside hydrolase family 15 protein [Agromyces atrinae]|uniref:GH15 family glucan-1,4-alpha-glucosidase n=1 Tax=Agromyces atrinae TaxID=592376 RepID=A0A4Q2M1X2_9MICO|nr:glycoside hydrolase family 15 protein [Agromyces atrinae]NYD68540.1 GH15 family glucan-1,4-alpha-glucosidase [Agromyces atrinae]RXZ85925.1 glycoside hydrolase family 15 protein [Agromyces atrinae]
MPLDIDQYALLADSRTGALVGADGSIDWLCVPRFDAASVFGALLGDADHGRWLLAPVGDARLVSRAYDGDTFTLETVWATDDGVARVTDVMPVGDGSHVVRRIEGVSGRVVMRHELRVRFDYAEALPWVRQGDDGLVAVAGPDALVVRGLLWQADGFSHEAIVSVTAGERVDTVLSWFPSYAAPPATLDVEAALRTTRDWWADWAAGSSSTGLVRRSLLVLRALSNIDTGGIVAAATTSLPEDFGGSRNWDYRFVWLRDAALAIEELLAAGFTEEAAEWRDWLIRAVAGDPADVQIMYGVAGERRLTEWVADSLPGYRGSAPVRIGNAAFTQTQVDVFGEVLRALGLARDAGLVEDDLSWPLEVELLTHLETIWQQPDRGIWEIRGPARHFVHSRAMAWAAFDAGIRGIDSGRRGPRARWALVRDAIRASILADGVAPGGWFRQHDETDEVDASLLVLPMIGFCAADDPIMLATVERIEQTLVVDGLVRRYRTESGVDGVEGGENAFLACSFWLVQQYARSGRADDAQQLFDRLSALANDVGLLAEQYDSGAGRAAGNVPQALSHLTLVAAARALAS